MILSKDPESILPPKVKLLYTDFKLISQAHYFKIFSAVSKTSSQPFTVRALDLKSIFYNDNPNLAATLFMQELLRLTTLHPSTVIIEDFEICDKAIVFVTKPYHPLDLLVKENDEGIKNIDVEKLIKDILVDLNFLVFGLGINNKNISIHIDLDNMYQVSGDEGYILGDWAKGLGNEMPLDFSELKTREKDDSNGDREIQTFAFKILELSGIKKEDLQDLQDLIGIRNPKTCMAGLDNILNEISQPDSVKRTLKSMLTKEIDSKLKLRDVVKSPCKKIMEEAKVDKSPSIKGPNNDKIQNRISRFEEIRKVAWKYDRFANIDGVTFKVSRDVQIIGIGLYTPKEEGILKGVLKIVEGKNVDGKILVSREVELTQSMAEASTQIYLLKFEKAIRVIANQVYSIVSEFNKGPSSYSGTKRRQNVYAPEAVMFELSECEGSNNGTGINQGQFPEIHYSF